MSGRGILKTGYDIRAEVDLHLLARVYGGRMAEALDIPARKGGRGTITVDVDFENGVITGWRSTTANFLSEVEAAGHTLPAELAGFESAAQGMGGANVTIEELGEAVVADPPPDSEVC